MGKQIFQITGMTQDVSPSKFPADKAFKIKNMRLTAQEDTQFMTLTSEKGNSKLSMIIYNYNVQEEFIHGIIVGYYTILNYLIVFSHDANNNSDYIYRFYYTDSNKNSLTGNILYSGNLGFNNLTDHTDTYGKLEITGFYENENIIKVYWIDGFNQPRFINVAGDTNTIDERRVFLQQQLSPFDFVPELKYAENIKIQRNNLYGLFPSGTIQYVLTYFNVFGAQSKPFYVSPIYYISPENRGGTPEETVANSFTINIDNPDRTFDYIRAYSIIRTSENGTPICKCIGDYSIKALVDPVLTDVDGVIPPVVYNYFHVINKSSIRLFKWYGPMYTDSKIEEVDLNKYKEFVDESLTWYNIPNHSNDTPNEMWTYAVIAEDYNTGDTCIYFPHPSNNNPPLCIVTQEDTEEASIGFILPDSTDPSTIYKFDSPIDPQDIPEYKPNDQYVTIVDTNTSGYIVDPNEVIYVGGQYIVPQTMEQLRDYLFFGNYKYAENTYNKDLIDTIKDDSKVTFYYKNPVSKGNLGTYYQYNNQLKYNKDEISTFKGGETYIFGIVLQDKYGEWSPVFPLNPTKNTYYPNDSASSYRPVGCRIELGENAIASIFEHFPDTRRIKAVLPDTELSSILCQGVLCPTVFSRYRMDNNPYAQASWFFRPNNDNNILVAEDRHNHIIGNLDDSGNAPISYNGFLRHRCEIYGSSVTYTNLDVLPVSDTDFFIDRNIITLNSPEIDTEKISIPDSQDIKLRIIGLLPINSSTFSSVINVSNATRSEYKGLTHGIIKNNLLQNSVVTNDVDSAYSPVTSFAWSDYYCEAALIPGPYSTWDYYHSQVEDWFYYPIYPWQRSGNLGADLSNYAKENPDEAIEKEADLTNSFGTLSSKVVANLRISNTSLFFSNSENIKNYSIICKLWNETIPATNLSDNRMYFGNYDRALLNPNGYKIPYYSGKHSNGSGKLTDQIMYNTDESSSNYPSGETSYNATYKRHYIISKNPIPMQYNSTPHAVIKLPETNSQTTILPYTELDSNKRGYYTTPEHNTIPFWKKDIEEVYPYQIYISYSSNVAQDGTDTIEIDTDSYTVPYIMLLKSTVESLLGASIETFTDDFCSYIHLYLPDYTVSTLGDNQTYKFIWTGYTQITETIIPGDETIDYIKFYPYPFYHIFKRRNKDKSITENTQYNYTPYKLWNVSYQYGGQSYNKLITLYSEYESENYNPCKFWYYVVSEEDYSNIPQCVQDEINLDNETFTPDLQKYSLFLGELYYDSYPEIDFKNVKWISAGQPILINSNNTSFCCIASTGDTYYQRYDCLKTYPKTTEDQNQIIEIFSFMCETKVNIDGRTDTFRGSQDNTYVTKTNFNILNSAYSQKDNFVSHNILTESFFDNFSYPNQIIWSNPKISSSLVDSWSTLIPLSNYIINGDKGSITALKAHNDRLLIFQDNSLSLLNYNERTAIPTSDNVPIEITNSQKISGHTTISNRIGCKNKYSILSTPYALYFADSNTKDIYAYSQSLNNISKVQGMNTFMYNYFDFDNMHTNYDEILKSVYFTDNNNCILYDEQTSSFISFLDYNKSDIFNFEDTLVSLHQDNGVCNVWKQFSGDYNTFFDVWKPYGLEIISNDTILKEKIFTNIEYQSDIYNKEGSLVVNNTYDTFDTLIANNEYQQETVATLEKGKNLQKKFRIWRASIPREEGTLRRFRNPWIKLGLYKMRNKDNNSYKTVLHNGIVYYI